MPSTIKGAWIVAGDPFREEWVGTRFPLPGSEEGVRLMEFQQGQDRITVDVVNLPQSTSTAIRFQGVISGTARDLVGQVGYVVQPFGADRIPIFTKALEEWSPILRKWCYQEITTGDAVSKLLGILPGVSAEWSPEDWQTNNTVWLPLPGLPKSSSRMWIAAASAAAIGFALGIAFVTHFAQVPVPLPPPSVSVKPVPSSEQSPQASPAPEIKPQNQL